MRLAVLANGPSLNDHDLSRVKMPIMGVNRSWKVCPDPQYHVCLETWHYTQNPEYFHRMAKKKALYVAGGNWPCGKVLPFARGGGFSMQEADGVVTEMYGVGSTFYAALQVAYWLGYRTVYALGLDLSGGVHFDGSPASPNVERQNQMFAHVPQELVVLVAGSPNGKSIFPKVDVEEVYG